MFEKYLSTHFNTSVYGFDCTNSKKEDWDNYFEFHPWCLGRKKSFQGNIYSKNAPDNSNGSSFEFYSLKEIKKELGHQYVTVLKMDIEGFEWDILYQEIVHGDEEDLPELLLFELHTAGASRYFVPAEVVKGKGRREVTQLVKDLFDIGYRVTNIEINKGDLHCAEISLYKYR